jgi:hypothetical protein
MNMKKTKKKVKKVKKATMKKIKGGVQGKGHLAVSGKSDT